MRSGARAWPATAVAVIAALAIWGCAEDGALMGGCGDGNTDLFEECDDGNVVNGDGCDAFCNLESGAGIPPTLAAIQENVFTPSCAVCHFPGGTGPMPLHTEDASYSSLVLAGFSFSCAVPRVDPGNPDGSCLVIKMEGAVTASGNTMPPPPAPSLSQAVIAAIREWIRQGAPR